MRHVSFAPPKELPAWRQWNAEVEREQETLFAGYRLFRDQNLQAKFTPTIDDRVYKGSRNFVLPVFHDKCAYCETSIRVPLMYGDVEHYRPKGAVTAYRYDAKRSKASPDVARALTGFVDVPGSGQMGYFWLAYNIENLLPACTVCNRFGKRSFFPVQGRRLVFDENADPAEERMLVNPSLDDPAEHLAFDDDCGIVRPLTLQGAISIEVYGLNREGLPEARSREMVNALLMLQAWIAAIGAGTFDIAVRRESELDEYVSGSRPYSAAALSAVGKKEEEMTAHGWRPFKRKGIWPSEQPSRL